MSMHKQQKLPEQEQHNYHCRFCNKGFDSGRALGGHMRSHGIYNEPILYSNEGPSTTGAERDSADGNGTSHFCKNCGEEFLTLRSFSKHCCAGGLVAGGDDDDDEDDYSNGLSSPSSPQCSNRGKRPCRGRSRNPSPPPLVLTEEERLANYLVLLSTAGDNPVLRITEAGECSTSGRKELDQVVLPPPSPQPQPHALTQIPPIARPLFECKTCEKVFTSHQALGGHRASHKKVKGCFATRLEIKSPKLKHAPIGGVTNDRNNEVGSSSSNMALAIVPYTGTSSQRQLPKKSSKVHKCSICERQFPSGQALGGHKRCHWKTPNSRAAAVEPLSIVSTELQVGNSSSGFNVMHAHTGTLQQMFRSPNNTLDLNMPAPMDDLPEITLWLDVPTAIYLQPGRDNESENAFNVNIEEEGESREVRLTNLSDLIDTNERESGSTWLQIGIGSISNQESRADQPKPY